MMLDELQKTRFFFSRTDTQKSYYVCSKNGNAHGGVTLNLPIASNNYLVNYSKQ